MQFTGYSARPAMPRVTDMRLPTFALIAAVALAPPLAAAPPSARDFRLPPESSAQTPSPDRQGPVAPDVPESRRAAPTPTPTPRATSSPVAPPVAVPPIVVPPAASATPVEEPRAAPVRRAPSPTPTVAVPTEPTEPAPDQSAPAPSPAPSPMAPVAQPTPAAEGGHSWPWVLGALLLLAGAGFAAWARMRGRAGARETAAPEIERPRVGPQAHAPVPSPGEPLHVTLEPLRLSLTLMNAALAWRLEVANRGDRPLIGLTIGADMISAHASLTREEQLSGPQDQQGSAALPAQRIERLEPGESRVVEGEFRLPLARIVPIRQGNMALLLPLARFRVEAEGARPLVRTFAVGQPGNGAALQPFRLDQGPRIYPQLVQRAFT